MRALERPRIRRTISNAYDERDPGINLRSRSIKRIDTEITAMVGTQSVSDRIVYVPIAACANGDCLRGCYRECRSEAEHAARDLANRLRERFARGFGCAPQAHPSSDEAA